MPTLPNVQGDQLSSSGSRHQHSPTIDDFLVNWIAPEVLRGESFSQASDIYSLSLVFHEILTRLVPYDDLPLMRQTPRDTIIDMVRILEHHFIFCRSAKGIVPR